MSNFILNEEVIADGDIPIKQYTSDRTGLQVFIAQVESPIVKGDFVFSTEALDDDGLPHTLEHLVFLGSDQYPYKGVLDLLANKCLADGTNAYTDTDHTNYSLITAGSDGFLNLLPIYLEHLLFPTLTDSGYITEVHHVNGKGEDAGVVYCEMQATENTGDTRCEKEMLRALYPGRCGYKSNTGGALKNLRESTSNEKVRDYHDKYYRAKNLAVVVTGPVEPEQVFHAIETLEDKIVHKENARLSKEFERPWQTPVEPLESSTNLKIQYSSDSSGDGLVYIGFRGPVISDNCEELKALAVLLDYLDSTAASPLQRDFVECDEPYCSSVSHYLIENTTSCFYLTFDSVGLEYLDLLSEKFFKLLDQIAKGEEKFNLSMLKTTISRKIVQILSTAETSPHSVVAGPIIGHFLYGTGGNLKMRCQEIPLLEKFLSFDEKYWLNLIDKYITGPTARYACIVGEPSPSLMKQMSKGEEERLSKQKETLKDKLPLLAEALESAVKANEIPPPEDVLRSMPVPSLDRIKFHSIERTVVEGQLPFRLHVDSIKTNFITIHLLINTSRLTRNERLYLPLLTELLLECPIERDGRILSYEEVVEGLFSDSIGQNVDFSDINQSLFQITLQVEIGKYEKAIQWFTEFLYKTIFTPERIKTIATRIVSDISQSKRSGRKVTGVALNGLIHQSNSNRWAGNFMRQQKFLKQLIKNLIDDPENVKSTMTAIRDKINRPNNFFVHMALDSKKLSVEDAWKPWLKLVPGDVENPGQQLQISDITPSWEDIQFPQEPKSMIVGVGSVESNYMQQVVKSLNSYTHPDLPAIYVLVQYLTQCEGPLWRQLRGLGLSYGYSIQLSPRDGLMLFALIKSTHVAAAYNKTIETVNSYINGEEEFQDNLFEAAKSSLIFEFIKLEKSAAGKSDQSLKAYLRDTDIDFNENFIKKIATTTKDDLRRVAPIYLTPLFKDPEVRSVVCCHPTKITDILEELKFPNIRQIVLEEEPLINLYN